MKDDKINQNIEKALKLLKSGDLPETISKITFPVDSCPCSAWSMTNRLLAYLDFAYGNKDKEIEVLKNFDFRGFKQWNDIGRKVKKGSSAQYILVPLYRKIKKNVKNDKGDDEKKEFNYIYGFKNIPVFHISQTTGKEVKHSKLKLPELPFKEVSNFLGLSVIPVGFNNRTYGSYSPSTKIIQLATPEQSTYLHELSHAVDDYLLKKIGKKIKGGQQKDQEVIAQFCSLVLSNFTGIKIKENASYTKKYIENYGGDEDFIFTLLHRIEKIITFITNFKKAKSPTRQMEEKTGEAKDDVEKLADNPEKIIEDKK